MKRIFWIIILCTPALNVLGQQSRDDFKSMIDSAVCLKYAAFKKSTKNQNIKYYTENLYLLNEQNQPYDNLPSSVNFKSITVYGDASRKMIEKGIYAWKVFTSLKQNRFTITIIDYYITYKKRNYNFANGGGAKTIFEYQCDRNDWILVSSVNKGN